MVNTDGADADTPRMRQRPDVEHRNRLVNRVSAVGQLSALVAMASTGVTAGVLAHDAKLKDLAVAQARQQRAPSPAPVQVRLVPRPIRTVLVRVAAPKPKRASTTRAAATAPRATTPVVRAAAPRAVQPAPRPVAKPASQPAATTSTGS